MKYNKKVLPNGLTLLSVPSREAESVVVDVFVKTGSRSESEKEAGMSHFLEHFLFKGTEKYPTAMTINEIVDGIGGDMNASTSKEYTQFYIKARGKHLGLISDILADMIQKPLFDEVELEKEKGVIVEEMNMRSDSPQSVVGELLDKIMWPGEPFGREIIGYKKTVTSFKPKDFLSYMHRHYVPGNMVLGVSGHYSEKELQKLIGKYWSALPKKRGGGWVRVKDRQTKPRVKVEHKKTEQSHVAFGFKSFAYEDKRNPAVAVLSVILGGGMSSRLWDEIREKRGLAYYVSAGNGASLDTGQFYVAGGMQVGRTEEAVKIIWEELLRITRVSVSEKELQKAKEYLKGKTALALEDNQAKLDWYLEQVAFKKNIRTPDEALSQINRVTASQVMSVAKSLFSPANASLAVVGPNSKEANLKKIISKI